MKQHFVPQQSDDHQRRRCFVRSSLHTHHLTAVPRPRLSSLFYFIRARGVRFWLPLTCSFHSTWRPRRCSSLLLASRRPDCARLATAVFQPLASNSPVVASSADRTTARTTSSVFTYLLFALLKEVERKKIAVNERRLMAQKKWMMHRTTQRKAAVQRRRQAREQRAGKKYRVRVFIGYIVEQNWWKNAPDRNKKKK